MLAAVADERLELAIFAFTGLLLLFLVLLLLYPVVDIDDDVDSLIGYLLVSKVFKALFFISFLSINHFILLEQTSFFICLICVLFYDF
jgi:hypothetical protein